VDDRETSAIAGLKVAASGQTWKAAPESRKDLKP
jgi:hypothetical protein